MEPQPRLSVAETLGLSPLSLRAREAWLALRGGGGVPPTRFDHTSLGILLPALSVRTWLGWRPPERLAPVSNLFNRTPTDPALGWSVRKTQTRDFRGGARTYDSHNGTDIVLPPGTVLTAAASGRVLRVSSEFNRGGLKLFVDHGRGLVTTSNHLARALVREGEEVHRGQPVALSGYSGLDAVVAFPWSAPHVHFNVWLEGEYVDPFAQEGEASLWLHGNDPRPSPERPEERYEPTPWDEDAVVRTARSCVDPALRAELEADARELPLRAMTVLFYRNYYPTRFAERPALHVGSFPREPRLTLPLRPEDYDGLRLLP